MVCTAHLLVRISKLASVSLPIKSTPIVRMSSLRAPLATPNILLNGEILVLVRLCQLLKLAPCSYSKIELSSVKLTSDPNFTKPTTAKAVSHVCTTSLLSTLILEYTQGHFERI